MSVNIRINGLEKLQQRLERAPIEIEALRWEILKKYAKKIEIEAKAACPTKELEDSVIIKDLPNGNFVVKCSSEAKKYVEQIIKINNQKMRNELCQRICEIFE